MEKLCNKCITLYIEQDNKDLILRLKRIKGQVEGIMKMMEEGRTCIEVLAQLSSLIEAAKGIKREIMRKYLKVCIKYAIVKEEENVYEEIISVFNKFFR